MNKVVSMCEDIVASRCSGDDDAGTMVSRNKPLTWWLCL